jgi:hypothetical protein
MVLAATLCFFVMAGCATQKASYSGFLKEYPTFEPGKEGVDERYVKKGFDFSKYNKVMMDEVVFYFKSDADYKGIQPSEINDLNEEFNNAFIDVLSDSYPLTDTPGPDVMRIRVAITDLEPSSPVAGTMSTVIPVGLAFSLIKKGTTGEYAGIGSASMEAEFLDSMSNDRIAAVIDRVLGGKFDVGKLSAAKSAFKFWAKRLKDFLDEAHGKKS